MAQFISQTLDLLATGDLSADDACYSLSVYLASIAAATGYNPPPEADIQTQVGGMVNAVANGTMDTEAASAQLINFKGRLTNGTAKWEPLSG